jgi:hypothetical protein
MGSKMSVLYLHPLKNYITGEITFYDTLSNRQKFLDEIPDSQYYYEKLDEVVIKSIG